MTSTPFYYYATGRRKTSVARVRLYSGSGAIVVNGKPLEEIFTRLHYRAQVLEPFAVASLQGKFNAQIRCGGGGTSGWVGAIRHGIARALVASDANLRRPLKQAGLLTRDSREKERKKPGLKRARKAPQYTKR